MHEDVIGANTAHILRQQKFAEGSLTITHNKHDIVANTIGHVLAIPTTHTILWTWNSAFKNPSKELGDQLFERYKDVPWKGDVLVRVGHSSIFGDIKRILARNEDVKGRPWLLKDKAGRALESVGKLAMIVNVLPAMIMAKLLRADFYSPFANSVNVYHPKLALGMHELGHAKFFNQLPAKERVGYLIGMMNPFVSVPFLPSFIEWQASKNAMKHFKNDQERREGLKRLEAGWATYFFSDILTPIPLPKPVKDMVGAFLAYPASVAGHAMARWYPKQNERFGYVFEGKDMVKKPAAMPMLGDRQMLVAMANPSGRYR